MTKNKCLTNMITLTPTLSRWEREFFSSLLAASGTFVAQLFQLA